MKLGPKRRQLLEGLCMMQGNGMPLHWLKLPFQHLVSRLVFENLAKLTAGGFVQVTEAGRKAVRRQGKNYHE